MPNKQPNDIHPGLQRSEASQAQKQTRTEMTEMANKKLICRVNQNWFFKNTNKANKPLAKLTQRKRQKTQNTKMREERGGSLQMPMKSRASLGNTLNTQIPKRPRNSKGNG